MFLLSLIAVFNWDELQKAQDHHDMSSLDIKKL